MAAFEGDGNDGALADRSEFVRVGVGQIRVKERRDVAQVIFEVRVTLLKDVVRAEHGRKLDHLSIVSGPHPVPNWLADPSWSDGLSGAKFYLSSGWLKDIALATESLCEP